MDRDSKDAARMNPDKGGAGAKVSAAEAAGKQGLKGGPKGVPSALVPPNLTERQQLALLLKQTKTESVPAPSESDSEVSDDSDDDGSSSGGDNRRKRKGGHGERENVKRPRGEGKQTGDPERSEMDDRRRGDEKKEDEGRKQIRDGQEGGIRDGDGQGLDETAPAGFGHSGGRLPPPIPMPRGMGKRTRVRQRRTGAGDLRLHEGSGSGEDDDDPLPVWRPEEFASWPPAKQAAWNNLAIDANAFYEKYAPPGHELDLGEWTLEEQTRFVQMLKDHPVENDQWGLFSMHFPSRNGMQCRQLHAKLVKSGVISTDRQAASSGSDALTPVAAAPSPGTSDATPAKRDDPNRSEVQKRPKQDGDAGLPPQKDAGADERPGVPLRTNDYRESSKQDGIGGLRGESTKKDLSKREAGEDQLPKKIEAGRGSLERRPSGDKGNLAVNERGRKPVESERGEDEQKGDRRSAMTTDGEAGTEDEETVGGSGKVESRAVVQGKDDATKGGHGAETSFDTQRVKGDVSGRDDVSKKDGVTGPAPGTVSRPVEGVRILHLGGGAEGKGKEKGSDMPKVTVKPITAADMAPRAKGEAPGGGHRKHRDKNDRMAGVKIIRRNTDAPTSVTLVRRHLAPHLMAKAPAVALALPAIAKPVGAGPAAAPGKQMRMPNGKFGPSMQPKPKSSDEGGGPITLYRMVDGEKVSLTIRKREGEGEDGEVKKRSHKPGVDSEGEAPKGLTVVLGGKTVHKRKRLSDPARAASPARERAKESEAGGLKRRESSDALFKAVKKVRIRHPASDADPGGGEGTPPGRDDKQPKKRKRMGGEAPLRWAFATTPRLASNPSTPHSNAEGGQANHDEEGGSFQQPGGMSARVSSRELQQLLPASSPAYSPLLSLASSRKRDRDVLNGPFRRAGGGFEDPQPPIHTRRLLAACKLLGVLDRREAKWHASVSGGWKDGANGRLQDPSEAKEDPTRAVEDAIEGSEEAPRVPDDPPETGPDTMQIDDAHPEAEKAPASANEPPKTETVPVEEGPDPPETKAGAPDRQENEAVGAEKTADLEAPSGGGTEGDPSTEGELGKVPEAILRRREELFAERVKLQKRWLFDYEILESSFERQYERALDDEPATDEEKGAAAASTSNHALRSTRGQAEGAHPFLRSADGASPAVPHQMSKRYVEVLFERCREDLLRRYQMEADTLDNWHRWLAESSGSLAAAARIALEQIPLDPRHLIDV